ncbi:NDP-sugar epimerase, includes UDP-GlcNAc-inverting 4,6-dehydratase FlaA1 and capsular polysaccharide biosynthesis protein EpsC [Soonwooa buanensis]|uniref:NDP-sugar epimerase, includes UDP-GlcNAc-inverting 4,6-dehydratase FlaA1 and capsular polysaccharide biosynthesis protein EpsC n=1 Tax=Soonwooa buanensis TaxID=619805 RepID=A0A1T5EU24_9FLAO|nr:nucleoside-diphosphate sugar epimerase/dehydratase [Soonwooa buanensis]SKB87444.1 NDP-sugar epimerase, includes UDP-GlcNAc-inverting 4,6-dehydratase FlaA1 and capsular polysaccharide biosynthesis protein EpsC [Soonwooa buanensis]
MLGTGLGKRIYTGDNLINISDIRYLPRWVVFIIDISILIVSLLLTYFVIMKMKSRPYDVFNYTQVSVMTVGINVLFMYLFKTYAGVIRHSTFIDLLKIMLSCLCTAAVLFILNLSFITFRGEKILLNSFIALYFLISAMFLFMFRLVVKEVFHFAREISRSDLKKRIMVLGTDEQSIAIARAILDNPKLPYHVVSFISTQDSTVGIGLPKILGKTIVSKDWFLKNTKEDLDIEGVIMVKESFEKEAMDEWIGYLLEKDLRILKAPSVQKLRSTDNANFIKTVQIEDLLNRKPIRLDNEEVKKRHFNREVLITGGAGSIGSEIINQVAKYSPSLVVVVDQAETPLYEVELQLREKFPHVKFVFVLADISNKQRIEPLFKKYNFSMVYHAAAYKHVPLVESNPQEAVRVNVLGSKNLATLSSQYNVNRFVMVSTDKAVNPTNVMGATKRVAELFVQSLQNLPENKTKFITTRFGNVLGSNGSVIPHFRKQIEKGGPITITHPDIVRYFMTIPEACELVLHAGIMGNGGEIYVFDMGQPVKILDLANRMIKLSGFEPETDIKIIFTGLRPGEKLYEELLSDDAKTLPTNHEKILISKDPVMSFEDINGLVMDMLASLETDTKFEAVAKIKTIVKEFKSNNSEYESLDK